MIIGIGVETSELLGNGETYSKNEISEKPSLKFNKQKCIELIASSEEKNANFHKTA